MKDKTCKNDLSPAAIPISLRSEVKAIKGDLLRTFYAFLITDNMVDLYVWNTGMMDKVKYCLSFLTLEIQLRSQTSAIQTCDEFLTRYRFVLKSHTNAFHIQKIQRIFYAFSVQGKRTGRDLK